MLGGLTASVSIACLGATIWGISPLAAGTLGWYSVYGHALVATILLVVLDRVTRLGAARPSLRPRSVLLSYALLLAGTTCFGTGISVALVFPLVLFLLLPEAWRQRGVRLAYLALPLVTVAAFFGLKRLAEWVEPPSFGELLQQSALVTGLRVAPAILAQLLGFAVAGSTLGHFFEPEHYPDVRDYASIVAFGGGLALVASRGDWKTRRAALAMVALALGIYTVVAVGRSNLVTMFRLTPVQVAATPRYHYVGTVPIVVLLCQMLQEVGRIGWLTIVPRGIALAAGLGVLVVGYAQSTFQIDAHSPAREYVARTTREIADAVAATPRESTVYLENGITPGGAVGP